METIVWITPYYFIETDIYIIPLLTTHYRIEWYIYVTNNEPLPYEEDIAKLSAHDNLTIHVERIHGRQRSLTVLRGLSRILRQAKRLSPRLVYTCMSGFPYLTPLVRHYLGTRNTVIAAHNVTTPQGASSYQVAQLYTSYTLKSFRYFQTFSKNQYNLLKRLYPEKEVFYAPFILKDYGASHTTPGRLVTFLSFGYIRDYKRIDVLINAAEKVYEETQIPFKVRIAGKCNDWEKYQQLIRHPELFDLQIRSIPNEEVADLFGSCHYFVTPYQDIAQSGSLIVGINYEKPVIASDLEAFKEYIQDNETGFLMKPASVDDLARIMMNILLHHESLYPALCDNVRKMKETEFAPEAIVRRYTAFFNHVMQ